MSRVTVYFFKSYCRARRSICSLRCSSIGKPCLVLMFSLGVWAPVRVAVSAIATMIRIFLISLRFGIFSRETFSAARTAWLREFLHQIRELREQVVRIVWARGGLRVVLHAEEGQFLVPHALVGVIVQIDVRDFHIARRKRFRVHAEAMVLRGNF